MYFFPDFVISSTPMSKRPQGRVFGVHSSVAPYACSFPVLKRIDFASVTMVMSNGSRGGKALLKFSFRSYNVDHLSVQSPPLAKHRHVSFHLFLFRTGSKQVKEDTLADRITPPTQQLRQSVYFVASALFQCSMPLGFQRSSSSCCGLSRPSTQVPKESHEPVSQNFPICSLRSACSETSLQRNADNRFCASFLLDVRCRLKND